MPRQAKERQKEGTKRKRTVPVLDTQSSLKLIAETAVSEDSHHGGPVLGGGDADGPEDAHSLQDRERRRDDAMFACGRRNICY